MSSLEERIPTLLKWLIWATISLMAYSIGALILMAFVIIKEII